MMEIMEAVLVKVLYQGLLNVCQLSAEKIRRVFGKSPEDMTEVELSELTDRNEDAAWAMYVQMLTRVTTQPLPDEDGDEQTALDSVHSLFKSTRKILTEYGRTAHEFSKLAVLILNQKIRPFTTKWHVPSTKGAFKDPEKCKEFRQDLRKLQGILCGYMAALAALAGVEDFTDISEE